MERFSTVTAKVIPLPLDNVDTDMIIPAQFMTSISREGYGRHLFHRLRSQDPHFPFNLARFQGSGILVAGENFGCGSSREHAVWALMDWGIKTVIAKSFADIFSGNAGKNGLLLVKLPPGEVDAIAAAAQEPGLELTVDLEAQTISSRERAWGCFDCEPFLKHCLLNGMDDIDYILSFKPEIEAFRARQGTRLYPVLDPAARITQT